VPTRKSSGPHQAARHRRSSKPTPKAASALVPPLVAAATGVTLIAAGGVSLPTGANRAAEPRTEVGAVGIDAVERAAAADRGSRSGARAEVSGMSLSEAAEAVSAERDRLAQKKEDDEAEQAKRADLARAEALRTRWVSPLPPRTYDLLGAEGEGVALAAESGAPVHAIGTGTIRYAGTDDEYGQMIVIEHWDGTITYYCYLSSFEQTEGEVAVGELIGRVGNTGTTRASHLHLQIRPRGEDPVDPLEWLAKRGVDLDLLDRGVSQ
jgi:murein DD-endopeptidase MepM/ murein hydrolase activator NlpD